MEFSDIVYSATENLVKEFIMAEIKKRDKEIKKVIKEQITDEYLKDQIKDFITYDEGLSDFIRDIAVKHLQSKMEDILK